MIVADQQLKDFQSDTVDYVFTRFCDTENPCNRFLVADEVGLGKTLIARGLIGKMYEQAKSLGKRELRVVYFCSNQSIASQNINRLNVEVNASINPSDIGRVNDLAISDPDVISKGFLKIIPLSPNTSVKISRGGGVGYERAILFHIVVQNENFAEYRDKLKKLLRLTINEYDWNELTGKNSWVKKDLRDIISQEFNRKLNTEVNVLESLVAYCEERYNKNDHYSHRRLIGELRRLLATVCVKFLNPDLIILDEFQRFKSILSADNESEERLITESLFNDESTKILLLSATPYKMYTIQSEDRQEESHFEEFKFIVDFLLHSPEKQTEFEESWNEYSKSLLHLTDKNWDNIIFSKRRVETILKSIIARTERISVSDDKNTLLRFSDFSLLWVTPKDIQNFIAADRVASLLKDVSSPIEYCKSSPFPFSFMEGYQLQRITQREINAGNTEVKSALKKSKESFLPVSNMDDYVVLDNPNIKLEFLLNDSLYNGGCDLLWIPPSLPYYEFCEPYKGKETYSKTLVFSSWIMVPKMIASLSSFECERLTIGDKKAIDNADDRSERKYFQTGSERHPKARLRFRVENDNYSTLSSYALQYPCLTLTKLWKPLSQYLPFEQQVKSITEEIENLISQIPIAQYITEPSKKDDERWALIYMLLLDRKFHGGDLKGLEEGDELFNWEWFNKDDERSHATQYFEKVFFDILFANAGNSGANMPAALLRLRPAGFTDSSIDSIKSLKLGHPPGNITQILAYLTIGSPAICSNRHLSSYFLNEKSLNYISFYGAFKIADSFRKFFNVAENIAVVDKYSVFDSYWKNVCYYNSAGNFQAMFDEFATAMIDHNGLWGYSPSEKVNQLIDIVSSNIGLRTASVVAHTYESFIKDDKPKHLRCHFGVALNQSLVNEKEVLRSDNVRDSFNSPFRPFILATTSIGQEGLDFHLYCRKILHWNLPANPVDFEQREGRINRFKNLAVRQNLAIKYGSQIKNVSSANVWDKLYQLAIENEKQGKSDLVPFWHVEPEHIFIERQAPVIPYSKEVKKLKNLLKTISVYRIALGQPRQEDLVNHLVDNFSEDEISKIQSELLINLSPYKKRL